MNLEIQAHIPHCRRRATRTGAAYVLVLSIATLVSVMGVSALIAVRVQLRSSEMSGHAQEATTCAQSGIELARLWISQDPAWRANRASGDWATGLPVSGTGTVTVNVSDDDGSLSNDPLDPVRITATGYSRGARRMLRVTLAPELAPMSCLKSAIASGGSAGGDADVTASGAITSNGSMVITGIGVVDANVEAVGSISGSNYLGSKVSGAPARQFPASSDVFGYYIANGTTISFNSTSGKLEKMLLSPANNPYGGATNASGIYIINCGGNKFEIKDSRIVGTLVLLNAKSDSRIAESVNWSPAVANLPALLVQGTFSIDLKIAPLAESGNAHFNPPHTPYNGVSNATMSDTFPSEINGLVYVSGGLSTSQSPTIRGQLVVGGLMYWRDALNVTYDPRYFQNPPPGFFDPPPMKPLSASWTQIVD
jgi:hypothetical protein